MASTGLAALAAGLGIRPALAAIDRLNIVVPASAGGGWDLTGRTVAKVLAARGTVGPVQVENIVGAGGTLALPQFLPRGDDQLSMMVAGFTMISSAITNQAPNSLAEAVPLARLSGEPHVLVVPANSDFQTLDDLVAALKANPSGVSVTGGAPGGSDHSLLGILALANDIDPMALNWIAYDGGGQAQTAVLGGHVNAAISNWSEFAGQVEAGRLRALALSSDKPIDGIAVQTFVEQGHDVVLFNWRGLFASPETSPEKRAELEATIAEMVATDAWKAELETHRWIDLYLPAAEFQPVLEQEIATITDLMQRLGFA